MTPVRIVTQCAMQAHRARIATCYLCGEPLPTGGGTKGQRMVEHVIPKRLLGRPDSPDWWPITLEVHRQCDQKHKMDDDNFVTLVQRMFTRPAPEWPGWGHYKRTEMRATFTLDRLGVARPAIAGIGPLVSGVATWIEGLHAALYGELLAPDVQPIVLAPVEAFDESMPVEFRQFQFDVSATIRHTLETAATYDCWDGITAWGETVRYRCAWIDIDGTEGHCLWSLVYPGVLDWSSRVRDSPMPWHGMYTTTLPTCAIILKDDFFERAKQTWPE